MLGGWEAGMLEGEDKKIAILHLFFAS